MSTLVTCSECTALRRSDIEQCFCRATETQPAPPPKKLTITVEDAA